MRPGSILTTAAAILSTVSHSVSAKMVMPKFDYYEPTEISPEVAKGGLQKLINGGVLKLEKDPNSGIQRRDKNQPKRRQMRKIKSDGYTEGEYYTE
jgi:hypothetical protein